MRLLILSSFILLSCASKKAEVQQEERRPNIIYILADDLGYGDLSSYGQQHFTTPNIDKLAEQGIKFTQHYSGSTVCAPSRSSLMTGLHTGHTPIRGNKEWKPEGQWPLPVHPTSSGCHMVLVPDWRRDEVRCFPDTLTIR